MKNKFKIIIIFVVSSILFLLAQNAFAKELYSDKISNLNAKKMYYLKNHFIIFNKKISTDKKVEKLKELQKFLQGNENIKCTMFYNPKNNIYGNDTNSNETILYIDKNYFELNKLNVESGTNFTQEDFEISNKKVPVICSKNYSSKYNVGDNITVDGYNCEIIGFTTGDVFIDKINGFFEEIYVSENKNCIFVPIEYKEKSSNNEFEILNDEIKSMIIESDNLDKDKTIINNKLSQLEIAPFNFDSFTKAANKINKQVNFEDDSNIILEIMYNVLDFIKNIYIMFFIYFVFSFKTLYGKDKVKNSTIIKLTFYLVTILCIIHFCFSIFSVYPMSIKSLQDLMPNKFKCNVDMVNSKSIEEVEKTDQYFNGVAEVKKVTNSIDGKTSTHFEINVIKFEDGRIIKFKKVNFQFVLYYGNTIDLTDLNGRHWTIYMRDIKK